VDSGYSPPHASPASPSSNRDQAQIHSFNQIDATLAAKSNLQFIANMRFTTSILALLAAAAAQATNVVGLPDSLRFSHHH
jgi:hypothetical protein